MRSSQDRIDRPVLSSVMSLLILLFGFQNLPFLAGLALLPIKFALLEWFRKAEFSSDRAGLLAVSEIYHPAWRAYVDGRETTVWRTNVAFRGVEVPEGEHEIRFAANNRTNQLLEEVRIVTSVGVKKCNDVIGVRVREDSQAGEACPSVPRPRLMDDPSSARPGNVGRPVDRPVVYHDHARGGTDQAVQNAWQGLLLVLSRNHHVYA